MQVAYEEQLAAKRANVIEQLVRIGGKEREAAQALVGEVQPSKRQLGYRNKIELAGSYKGGFKLGFHQSESNDIVETKTCLVATKALEKAPGAIRGALRYAQGNQDLGIFRVGLRSSARTRRPRSPCGRNRAASLAAMWRRSCRTA